MSSLPRPALMGIVGLLAVVALFMFTRGRGGNEEASAPSTPATAAPSETTPSTSPAPGSAAAPSGSATAPSTTPSESSKTTAPTAGPAATDKRTLPEPVKTALAKNKVVVLLIWDPRASVDQNVKSAVDGLSRRGGKVAVFTDKPENIARYTPITGPVDLSMTPTLIVVNRDEVARKATGYLDPVTVDQYVVDALAGAP
jgi:cytoskeletal protein RodZ